MRALYPKYEPGTYHSRELYRIVCETRDLRPVWAHKNALKWSVEYDLYLAKCKNTCSCCDSTLDYGLGKNNIKKSDVHTPSTDHIISRDEAKRLGWTEEQINHISNLWIVCKRCNTLKNNSTPEDIYRYKRIIEVLEKLARFDNLKKECIINI